MKTYFYKNFFGIGSSLLKVSMMYHGRVVRMNYIVEKGMGIRIAMHGSKYHELNNNELDKWVLPRALQNIA